MTLKSIIAALGVLASTAIAHGTVSGLYADGTYYGGWKLDYYYMIKNGQTPPTTIGWYAEDLDNGFVNPANFGTADIICHINATPGKIHGTVKAGGSLKFLWTAWPDSHRGPIITYMAKCPGACESVDKSTLKFVKIDAVGINTSTQKWAADDLIANNNTWTVKVPSKIAAGNYVFRHEIIALHGGLNKDGAQNYPQCFNIAVTGGGSDNPTGTAGPSLYKDTDPGINFNIYQTVTSYPMPGPTLYTS